MARAGRDRPKWWPAARLVPAVVAGLLLALAASGPAGGAEAQGTLTACVEEDNPPFSYAGPDQRGLDIDIARQLAQELQRALRLQAIRVPARGGMGKALKLSIQSGTCDIFMGLPAGGEMAGELADHHLVVSRPYLTLAYLLVSGPGSVPATLDSARRARRLGVATSTPADLFLFKAHWARIPYGNNRDVLAALGRGEVDMALAWSPAIALLQSEQGAPHVVVAAEQPHDPDLRTGLGIATRAADRELAAAIDTALAHMASTDSVSALASHYGLPEAGVR